MRAAKLKYLLPLVVVSLIPTYAKFIFEQLLWAGEPMAGIVCFIIVTIGLVSTIILVVEGEL